MPPDIVLAMTISDRSLVPRHLSSASSSALVPIVMTALVPGEDKLLLVMLEVKKRL